MEWKKTLSICLSNLITLELMLWKKSNKTIKGTAVLAIHFLDGIPTSWIDHSLLPPLLWIHSMFLLEAKAATGVPGKLTRQEAVMLGSVLGEIFISSLGRQTNWCKRKPTPSNWYTAMTSCWEIDPHYNFKMHVCLYIGEERTEWIPDTY